MKAPLLLASSALLLASTALSAQTMVAYYPFNGNADDSTAFGNDATVAGAELTAGYNGEANSAYLFDGVMDSIVAPSAAQLNTNTATYAFWVRPDMLVEDGEAYIFYNGGWMNRVKISLPAHGRPVFTTHTDAADSLIRDMDALTESLTAGTWAHVAMVHDLDSNTIYVNGLFAHRTAAPGNLLTTDRPVVFGSDADGTGGQRFTGAIDEFIIYGEALTGAQIADLYATYDSTNAVITPFADLGRVYPNPVRSELTLELADLPATNATLELVDARGARVLVQPLRDARSQVDVSALPADLYTLRVVSPSVQSATRVIVQ